MTYLPPNQPTRNLWGSKNQALARAASANTVLRVFRHRMPAGVYDDRKAKAMRNLGIADRFLRAIARDQREARRTRPTFHAGLHLSDGTELSGNGYARQQLR